jgi:hypothetical protein
VRKQILHFSLVSNKPDCYLIINTSIKLMLFKALIGSVMAYACLIWEYAADAHLLKLLRLWNMVLCVTVILTGEHQSTYYMWLSKLLMCMTI